MKKSSPSVSKEKTKAKVKKDDLKNISGGIREEIAWRSKDPFAPPRER